jgi:hypothetical protein
MRPNAEEDMMTKLRTLTGLVVCAGLACAAPARADVVTDWNAVTVLYVTTGGPGTPQVPPVGRSGPPGLLDIALVHVAMHDAIQAIERRFEPYHYRDKTKFGVGNPAAAAAAAAHRVLVLLYQGQSGPLDTLYTNYLNDHGLAGDPGLAVGEAAAIAVHGAHYRPVIAVDPFIGGDGIGDWRPTPPTAPTTAMAFQYMAVVEPFTLKRQSQFRPPPPPPLWSRRYARDYEEVKTVGNAAAHPNPTTDMARFWSGNFFAQWNQTVSQIAEARIHDDIGASARLLALANLAAADAAITVWDTKIHYNIWRPQTAINQGDDDGNPRTVGDVTWTPFLANPNYPDYSSGANGVTGAFTMTLRLFFGTDDVSFSVKNPNPLLIDKERHFDRISDAMQEVVDARVLLGIHFRFADEAARRQGSRVALWAYSKFLRPVHRGHR